MQRIIYSIALLGIAGTMMAQENIDVRFTVFDKQTNEKLPFVNVALFSPSDTVLNCTDDSGRVVLHVQPGEYTLQVSSVGYTTMRKVERFRSTTDYPVYLSSNTTLSEVKVTGRRQQVKMTATGIVYDMKADPMAQSSDLLTALQNVPLIIVDPNSNITVKGSSRYSIFLNGRPYRIAMSNPKDVLRSIPASTIAKVEIITSVDGRYDADAGDAIINIITEKQRQKGYTLSVNGGAATQPKANAGTTLIATTGNVDFSLGYNFNNEGQRHQPIDIDCRYTNTGESVKMLGRGNGDWNTHTVRGLLTWSIDSINSLYLDGHGLFKQTNLSTRWEQLRQLPGQKEVSTLFNNKNNDWTGTAESNIIYRHFLPSDKNTESFSIGYRYTYNPDTRTYYQDFTDTDANAADSYKRETRGGLNEHTLMVDGFVPLGENHELYLGGKQVYRVGNTRASLYELEGGQWTNDNNLGDDENMHYTQDISSVYASYVGRIWKLRVNGSLRWEYTHLRMTLSEADKTSRNTQVLLPHLGLSYRLGRSSQLSLNYSAGVQRAGITTLNPFTAVVSSYAASQGNPNLRDTHTHSTSLGLMKNGSKYFLSFDLNYQQLNNAVVPYSYLRDGTSMIVRTYDNIHRIKVAGANLYYNYRPLSRLSLTATGNVNYCTMESNALDLHQHSWEYNLTFFGTWMLTHGWSINGQYGNYKNRPDAWGKSEAFSLYSLSVSKSLLNNSLFVKLVVNSPFNRYEKLRTSRQYTGYTSSQTNYMIARSFGIDISYTLRSGKPRKIERDRSLRSTDQQTGIM